MSHFPRASILLSRVTHTLKFMLLSHAHVHPPCATSLYSPPTHTYTHTYAHMHGVMCTCALTVPHMYHDGNSYYYCAHMHMGACAVMRARVHPSTQDQIHASSLFHH